MKVILTIIDFYFDVLPDDAYQDNQIKQKEKDQEIFEKLCDEEKYVITTSCHICNKKGGMMVKLK